jgi:anti-sigma factor RsiW
VLAERPTTSNARRLAWTIGGAAAVLAAIAVIGVRSFIDRETSELAVALGQSHAASVGGDRVATSDQAAVERWIAARLPFAVYVPVFRGARLTGARIDVSERGRGAVIEYEVGHTLTSYFVLLEKTKSNKGPSRLLHAHASGYRAVIWTDAGLLHAMVGAVPTQTLEVLARECMRQMHQGRRQVALDNSNAWRGAESGH